MKHYFSVLDCKGHEIVSEIMSRVKRIGLNVISKERKEVETIYLLDMKILSIFYHQENINGLNEVIHTRGQRQITSKKNNVLGAFSSKGAIKLQLLMPTRIVRSTPNSKTILSLISTYCIQIQFYFREIMTKSTIQNFFLAYNIEIKV